MGGSQRHVQDKSYFVGILRAKMAELTTEIKNIQVRKPLVFFFLVLFSSHQSPLGGPYCVTQFPLSVLAYCSQRPVLHHRLSL